MRGRYLHNVDIPLPKVVEGAGLRLIDCGGAFFCFKCRVASFFECCACGCREIDLFGGWSLGLATAWVAVVMPRSSSGGVARGCDAFRGRLL